MDRRVYEISSLFRWPCTAWALGCLIAVGNWFNTWQSFGQTLPSSSPAVIDAQARMEHWIFWAVTAAALSATGWFLHRRDCSAG